MVDFNSEGAFTANKSHILELIILGRRDEAINTFQLWREAVIENSSRKDVLKSKLRGVLFALFLELERPLFRKLSVKVTRDKKSLKLVGESVEGFAKVKNIVCSVQPVSDDDLVKVFSDINTALDELNLIKIDNKRSYDTTNVERENEEKGL